MREGAATPRTRRGGDHVGQDVSELMHRSSCVLESVPAVVFPPRGGPDWPIHVNSGGLLRENTSVMLKRMCFEPACLNNEDLIYGVTNSWVK